jgi:hypothetical protein
VQRERRSLRLFRKASTDILFRAADHASGLVYYRRNGMSKNGGICKGEPCVRPICNMWNLDEHKVRPYRKDDIRVSSSQGIISVTILLTILIIRA